MTPPFIKFSGHSDSGKTGLVCDVVRELKDRGYQVGVLKHDPHERWEWDKHGTDTARHAEAGADAVSILSPGRHGLYQKHDRPLDVQGIIRKMAPAPDIVLLEGFKSRDFPGFKATEDGWEDHLGQTYSSESVGTIADRVIELSGINKQTNGKCELYVDGKQVPLKKFPSSALTEVLEGFVRSLNDVDPGESLSVEIHRNAGD
ncbi:MAG: molybdopterin-guanine dinucleotide biosynthesis protein B [bacterium]